MKGSVADILMRLTALSQELAGAFRPATIVEIVARALTEQLAPARLSVMLLDIDTNRLVVTYHNGPRCGAAHSCSPTASQPAPPSWT